MITTRTAGLLVCAAVVVLLLLSVVAAGPPAMDHGGMTAAAGGAADPIHITMDQLHANGGVPPRWKFEVPPGDPTEGRKVFVTMECFACHEVKGEQFPRSSTTPRSAGPDLTGMGGHHPAEYFAESIINPNRVIVDGQGYTGSDGLSKMPDYSESMTLKQLVDVVAYLKSLTGREGHHHTEDHAAQGSMKMSTP